MTLLPLGQLICLKALATSLHLTTHHQPCRLTHTCNTTDSDILKNYLNAFNLRLRLNTIHDLKIITKKHILCRGKEINVCSLSLTILFLHSGMFKVKPYSNQIGMNQTLGQNVEDFRLKTSTSQFSNNSTPSLGLS